MVILRLLSVLIFLIGCESPNRGGDDIDVQKRATSYIKRVSPPSVFELETPGGIKSPNLTQGVNNWNKLFNGEPRYIECGSSLARFDPEMNEFTWLIDAALEPEFNTLLSWNATHDTDVKIIQGVINEYTYYSNFFCFSNEDDERLWKKRFETMSRAGYILKGDYLWLGTSDNYYSEDPNRYYLSKINKLTGDIEKQFEFPAYIQKVLKYQDHLVLIQMPDKTEYDSGIDPMIIHWDPVSEDTIKTIRWPVEKMDERSFLGYYGPRDYIGWPSFQYNDIWVYMPGLALYEAVNINTGDFIYRTNFGTTMDPYIEQNSFFTADINGIYQVDILTGNKTKQFELFSGDEGLATSGIAGLHYGYTMTMIDRCLIFNIDYSFIRVNIDTGIYYVERVDKRLNGGDEDFGTGYFYKTGNKTYKVLYFYPRPSPPPVQYVIGEYKWEKNW